LLASGSWDEDIILWDFATGQQIANPLEGHDDFVNGLTFSPDGLTLYSSGRDDLILRWTLDPSNWQRRACLIAVRKLDLFEWFIYVGQGDFELDQACSQNFLR
jgi:WD40 repeat protein